MSNEAEVTYLRTLLMNVLDGSATNWGEMPPHAGSTRIDEQKARDGRRKHQWCHESCPYRQAWEHLDTVLEKTT